MAPLWNMLGYACFTWFMLGLRYQVVYLMPSYAINLQQEGLHSTGFMFLQKYRYQLPERNTLIINDCFPANNPKKDPAKRISAGELKSHQNKLSYSDPRKFLIENTQKAIRQKFHTRRLTKSTMKNYDSKDNIDSNPRDNFFRERYDLSKREERIMAAKKYREKIWKGSDIASLIRAQQELMQSRRSEHLRQPFFQSPQRVQRYRDLIKQFAEETTLAQKEKLKKEWFTAVFPNNSQKTHNSNPRNPEIQVTNIEFMESEQLPRNPLKMLMNREKRKEMARRASHITYSSHGKRPNTTGNATKAEENFIEPW